MKMITSIFQTLKAELASATEPRFSKSDLNRSYTTNLPSFASRLPYAGWDADSQTFILEDLISRSVVLTIDPIPTEGKTGEQLAKSRDSIADVYSIFDEIELDDGAWVIQEFSYEDNDIDSIIHRMREHVLPHAKGTTFTEKYIELMERHYRTINKDDGLYIDEKVTHQPWRFKSLRTKFLIYRRQSARDMSRIRQGKHNPVDEIQQVLKQVITKLETSGIKSRVDDDIALFTWLFKLFNPNPELNGFSSKQDYYEKMCDVDSDLLVGRSLCEALLSEPPLSDTEDNCWYFNGRPSRFLRFGSLRKAPRIGALTGEVSEGEGASETNLCLMDALPSNTILTKTVVIAPKTAFDERMNRVSGSVKGHGNDAKKMERNLASVDSLIQSDFKKVFVTMGAYISGSNLTELDDIQRKVITVLGNSNVMLYKDNVDSLGLESYINHLPMNFRPEVDKSDHYLRTMWAQHAANLFLGFGRGEGTGRPCISFFNRGGSPVFFDPFHKKDKDANSFGFIAGPAGAGKSVTITQLVYSIMAMKRPRLFLIEYGDSYSVAAKDWERKGLTVNYLKVMPDTAPNLAPFARLHEVLEAINDSNTEETLIEMVQEIQYESIEDDTETTNASNASKQGDVLGELELVLLLMITGSEETELNRYTRADRALFRRALIETAKRQYQKGIEAGDGKSKPTTVSNIIETLNIMANDESRHTSKRLILSEAALSLEAFTTGINHQLFNQPGETWPDADVTIFNVGLLSQDANTAQLNVAMLSLLQHINNLSEFFQSDPRDVVSITDESHLFLNNQMLGKILTRVVKTARKLGHIPFFATQDLADLEGESKKILNNIEWFYCLNFGLDEAKKVKDIKNLSDEDVHMMISTRKLDKCYTEGIAVSKSHRIMFRISPPSLMLAVAMTDSEEKSERRKIMQELGTDDELKAVYEVANRLDKVRGIEGRLEYV
ncbi:conjugative transfer ATPase [Vibrio metoecus]|nr:conjugative transfer ATPase [Vibrio cholerae]